MTPPFHDLPRLERLHRWLTLESWAGVVGLAGFWLPIGPLVAVLSLAAIVFTPMLVANLWGLRRTGWLVGFAVWVGGAAVVGGLLDGPWAGLRGALVLVAFYSYAWVLTLAVAEWWHEATEAAEWARTKAQWQADAGTEGLGLQA